MKTGKIKNEHYSTTDKESDNKPFFLYVDDSLAVYFE